MCISTALFHVYNVTFDGKTVTCYFIESSTASGCHIQLNCPKQPELRDGVDSDHNICKFSIEKDDLDIQVASHQLSDNCEYNCENFVLEVYDIYNGKTGTIPAKTITYFTDSNNPTTQSTPDTPVQTTPPTDPNSGQYISMNFIIKSILVIVRDASSVLVNVI